MTNLKNMKRLILTLVITFAVNLIFAQVATVQDEDGWTNLRSEPNGKSSILYEVKEGELFWYDFEYNPNESDWIRVYIPEDKLTLKGY